MPAVKPSIKQPQIPAYGVIRGGALNGWPFTFRYLEIRGKSAYIVCQVSEPHWPFPFHNLVALHGHKDFTKLANHGEVAPYLDSERLIEAAMETNK